MEEIQLRISTHLQEFMSRNNFTEKDEFMVAMRIKMYIDRYFETRRLYDEREALLELYKDMDEGIEKDTLASPDFKISCKKGCSYCCNIRVAVTEIEADIAIDYAKKKKINIDVERLKQQEKLNEETWMFSKYRACVFLKDGLCSIYPVRPGACRAHMVQSDPEMCNADVNAFGMVGKILNLKAEMIICAFMNICGENGNIATLLLKSLKSKSKYPKY